MNILLLQGPLGPFFKHLAQQLQQEHCTVYRIHFNGGDRFFSKYCHHTFDYTDTPDNWPDYIHRFLQEQQIDSLVVYGDCRYYHLKAIEQARTLGIQCHILEEGYLRPDWITLEKDGANANSTLLERFDLASVEPAEVVATRDQVIGKTIHFWAAFAVIYFAALNLQRLRFRHYRHHIPSSMFTQGLYHSRSILRKLLYWPRDRLSLKRLRDDKRPFFLLPLQVDYDAQLHFHSGFASITELITNVVRSFAKHAPKDTRLLIKHHPHNRGNNHYGKLIKALEQQYNLQGRLHYGHDWHMPTLLRHCQGVVTMNSTVGISALIHHLPVKVLGKAFWDIDGITDQQPLSAFWQQGQEPDSQKTDTLILLIKQQSQLRGSFYRKQATLAAKMAMVISSRQPNSGTGQQDKKTA